MKTDYSNDTALLEKGLAELGLGETARILPLLVRFMEEIELFNSAYGLVKVADRRELIVKHILDSLAPLRIIHNLPDKHTQIARVSSGAWHVADVGSGAGLPGIPLAVCMPDWEFTLIERMGRRAGFLRDALAVLGLSNVRVEETEMEKIRLRSGAGCFDLVVFRAFRPLEPAILKGLLRLVAPGGTLAAYKGRRESVEEEMAQVLDHAEKGTGPAIGSWELLPLEVPFLEEERHLVLIKP